jgi:hypothetical protein
MLRSISILLLVSFFQVVNGQTRVPKGQSKETQSKTRILKEWTLSSDFTEEINQPVDTVFSLAQRFKLADRYSPVNATLGNYGLPFYQINFFDRVTDPDKFLYSYYYPLMYVPSRALFMNTQVPFTELDWTFGGQRQNAEQTFRIRHSQNVNRFLNFGLIYDIVYSLGQYSYQRSDDRDFTFFSSYTGNRYKAYFSAGVNNITSLENGGVKDIIQVNQFTNMRDVPVNLGGTSNAKSILKNRSFLLVQRYTIGGSQAKDSTAKKGFFGLSGTFSHIFASEGNRRSYTDNFPKSGFYDTVFIDREGAPTFDTLSMRYIKNTVRFDFTTDESRKFRLGGGVGIRNEIYRYSQLSPTHDSTFAATSVWNRSNNVLVGKLFNNIGEKFNWVADGELYFTGYRAGDFNLKGSLNKSFDFRKGRATWTIDGSISNTLPSFWFQHWSGNNFEWDASLNKEFRMTLGTKFSFPARRAYMNFNYAIIDNYTGFDTTAMPFQHSGGLSVAALSISKELSFWKFHLNSDVILQKSSNSRVIDLPFFTIRSAGYFEHLFRFASTGGSLNTQVGFDVTYNSLYYPYSYMPATGRFYRQESVKAGDYPFVNAFLNLKIKRTRIFLMFDHLNSKLAGNGFYMVPSYPMNMRMFRYGLAWTFYD